jgi:hypothetical protein
MASTTNYGWTTPDDTSLVKDGAAAIRTLGSSIDSTVFANASAGIAKTIVDAKGDLIAATAADTVSRLAVGTNGQVLLADSSAATGLAWGTPAAGSLTLLSTTTMSGATTTVSSISQSYKHLYIVLHSVTASATPALNFYVNGSTSAITYARVQWLTSTSLSQGRNTVIQAADTIQPAGGKNVSDYYIQNYATTNMRKNITFQNSFYDWSYDQPSMSYGNGFYDANTAITSITFSSGGTTYTGGTLLIYGVN